MFAGNVNVVPIIAPLNEYVCYHSLLFLSFILLRPAGYDGSQILSVTKQVRKFWYQQRSCGFITFI